MLLVSVGQLEATRMAPARDFKPGRFQNECTGLGLVELEQLPQTYTNSHCAWKHNTGPHLPDVAQCIMGDAPV